MKKINIMVKHQLVINHVHLHEHIMQVIYRYFVLLTI